MKPAAVAAAAAQLQAAGIDNAAQEARWLAAHVAGTDWRDAAIDPARLAPLLARRIAREPLAYIIGHAPFWTLSVAVSPATLIPRADSETLIEAALAARPHRDAVRSVLDLGTGTGCLLLAALSEYPRAWGLGVDRAPDACRLAAANAVANHLDHRCAMLCADWAAPIAGRFDLVLSNPPYIPAADIAGLMPEVAAYEPRAALDGGADGLDAFRALLAGLHAVLAPTGIAVFELGAGQLDQVSALASQAGFGSTHRRDHGGHQRALILQGTGA